MRTCIKCKEIKELELFIKRSERKDGRGTICKACQSKRVRSIQLANPEKYAYSYEQTIKRHGLTTEKYEELKAKFDGKCWTCRVRPVEAIDHDHSCCDKMRSCGSCVRGLLCGSCNRVLGLVVENRDTLINMIDYLDASTEW